jgi:hypothetical protein
MATVLSLPEERVTLHDVSWETYESLLADHHDRSAPRFTYDQGVLEISSLPRVTGNIISRFLEERQSRTLPEWQDLLREWARSS